MRLSSIVLGHGGERRLCIGEGGIKGYSVVLPIPGRAVTKGRGLVAAAMALERGEGLLPSASPQRSIVERGNPRSAGLGAFVSQRRYQDGGLLADPASVPAASGAGSAIGPPTTSFMEPYQPYEPPNAPSPAGPSLGQIADGVGDAVGSAAGWLAGLPQSVADWLGHAAQAGLSTQANLLEGLDPEGHPYADMPFFSLSEPSRLGGLASFVTGNLPTLAPIEGGGAVFGAGPTFRTGVFGPVYHDVAEDWSAALRRLRETQTGEVPGALFHPEIGPIDVPWGYTGTGQSDGFGIAKLDAFHPGMAEKLADILPNMRIVSRSSNRVVLEDESHKASVRLEWDGQAKTWMLTAYEKTP